MGDRLADALKGKFDETQRLLRTSTRVAAQLSPDGGRVLLGRTLPSSTGGAERRFSVLPFAGGGETTLNIPGSPRRGLGRLGHGAGRPAGARRYPGRHGGRAYRRPDPDHHYSRLPDGVGRAGSRRLGLDPQHEGPGARRAGGARSGRYPQARLVRPARPAWRRIPPAGGWR